MPTVSLREAAMAAVAARLSSQIAGVTVERARRAPVDIEADTLPLLNVVAGDIAADETLEPDRTHYTIGFQVVGTVTAATDLATEQAASTLYAQVAAALVPWTPTEAGLAQVSEGATTFDLFEAEESARPAAQFSTQFTILAVGPTGGPWSS